MNNIQIGTPLKNVNTGIIKTVQKVYQNAVRLDDGGEISLDSIGSSYIPININNNTNIVTETIKYPHSIPTNDHLDPNSFFNNSSVFMRESLVTQISQGIPNNVDTTNRPYQEVESVLAGNGGVYQSQLSEETKRMLETAKMNAPKMDFTNDEGFEPIIEQPTVRQNPNMQQPIHTKVSSLPKMKKTQEVKVKLEFSHRIPDYDKIEAVDSLFDEEFSVIDSIASEIATRLINDRDMLEGMIIEFIKNEIKLSKKPKKAVVKVVKKQPVKVVKKQIVNEAE